MAKTATAALATTKPAQHLKAVTAGVREHSSAMRRAQDMYFAKLKRAEAEYFETVKRITDAITSGADTATTEEQPEGQAAGN